MARTVIGVGDPKAIKKWSQVLAVDVGKTGYFNTRFLGEGAAAKTPIQRLTHLENDAGDQISFDLSMQIKMRPILGDNILRGKEEDLKFYTDRLYIDQMRGGVNTGGKMTNKRTLHDLRSVARARQSEWWARLFDETFFIYLSGSRGANTDFIEPLNFTGYGGNPITEPDDMHNLFGGSATSAATVTATDKFSLNLIDRAVARAETMGGGTQGIPSIQPVSIDGGEHFVCVMHPWTAYDLRQNMNTGDWFDIQKALATYEGKKNPICMGGLGMHNGVILHAHKSTILFDNLGAGKNVTGSRSLFLGRQAGVVAFGSPGTGLHFDWNEELEDRGNQVVITTGSIIGFKKTTYEIEGKKRDFGVIALDSAVTDPNA